MGRTIVDEEGFNPVEIPAAFGEQSGQKKLANLGGAEVGLASIVEGAVGLADDPLVDVEADEALARVVLGAEAQFDQFIGDEVGQLFGCAHKLVVIKNG